MGEGVELEDRYGGQELQLGGRFCPNCGKPTKREAQVPTPEASVQPRPTQPPLGRQGDGVRVGCCYHPNIYKHCWQGLFRKR